MEDPWNDDAGLLNIPEDTDELSADDEVREWLEELTSEVVDKERERMEREESFEGSIEALMRARSAKHRKQLEDLNRIKERFMQRTAEIYGQDLRALDDVHRRAGAVEGSAEKSVPEKWQGAADAARPDSRGRGGGRGARGRGGGRGGGRGSGDPASPAGAMHNLMQSVADTAKDNMRGSYETPAAPLGPPPGGMYGTPLPPLGAGINVQQPPPPLTASVPPPGYGQQPYSLTPAAAVPPPPSSSQTQGYGYGVPPSNSGAPLGYGGAPAAPAYPGMNQATSAYGVMPPPSVPAYGAPPPPSASLPSMPPPPSQPSSMQQPYGAGVPPPPSVSNSQEVQPSAAVYAAYMQAYQQALSMPTPASPDASLSAPPPPPPAPLAPPVPAYGAPPDGFGGAPGGGRPRPKPLGGMDAAPPPYGAQPAPFQPPPHPSQLPTGSADMQAEMQRAVSDAEARKRQCANELRELTERRDAGDQDPTLSAQILDKIAEMRQLESAQEEAVARYDASLNR